MSDETKHTPGPWVQRESNPLDVEGPANRFVASCENAADARLIAAALDMLAALKAVNNLVSEAAMTGFNCHDGDWPEKLFFSQQATSQAISKAEGRPA